LPVLVDFLARAVDRVFLRVEKLFHKHDQLDLPPLVDPIAGSILCGMQKLELAFPVTQHVWLQIRQRAHVADREKLLHRFLRFHRSTSARSSLVMREPIALRADWPSKSTRLTA